jgi:hypothetical protein
VTGNIGLTSNALFLRSLETCDFEIDIGKFIMPRIGLGCSTVCAIEDLNLPFNKIRKVVAIGEITILGVYI